MGQSRVPAPVALAGKQQTTHDGLTMTGLLVGAYLAIFLCQFDVCMVRQERLRFAPAYLLLASLGLMAIPICNLAPVQIRRVFKECWGAILAFGLIAGIALVGSALPKANLADGWKYVFYPTVDFLVFLLALPLASIFASQSNWRAACGMALCALVMSILVDVRYPGTFSFLETRAAGFGVNPNIGAALVVLLLVGVLDWKRPTLSVMACGWCLVAFLGVFMTLSRSGILVLGIVGMLYVRLCLRQNGMGTVVVLCGLAFSIGGYVTISSDAAKRILPMLEGSHSRTNFFSGEFDAMDVREDTRVYLVYDYLKMVEERPLLGWGTGLNYSMDAGSHNMFLARWVENGIPGLGAYLLLIFMLYRIGRKFQSWECIAVAAFLAAESFFSHNLLEDKSLLLVMSISVGRAVLNGVPSSIGGQPPVPSPPSSRERVRVRGRSDRETFDLVNEAKRNWNRRL